MRDFTRFAATVLVLTAVAWCLLTLMGLGSGLDPAQAAARAAIATGGLLLWGLMAVGASYAIWAVVTAAREARAEGRLPADPAPDESDAKTTPP